MALPSETRADSLPQGYGSRVTWVVALLVLVAIVISAAKLGWLSCLFSDKCWTIQVKSIGQPTKGGSVIGQFNVIDARLSGVATDGIGGACIVFESAGGGQCSAKSDCPLPSTIPNPTADGSSTYCADKTCWVKVKEDHCWKSLTQKPKKIPMVLGEIYTTTASDMADVRAKLYPNTPHQIKTKARVVACLSGKYVTPPPPCGSGNPSEPNRIEVFGPPISVWL
jgi:hypothetical protein